MAKWQLGHQECRALLSSGYSQVRYCEEYDRTFLLVNSEHLHVLVIENNGLLFCKISLTENIKKERYYFDIKKHSNSLFLLICSKTGEAEIYSMTIGPKKLNTKLDIESKDYVMC